MAGEQDTKVKEEEVKYILDENVPPKKEDEEPPEPDEEGRDDEADDEEDQDDERLVAEQRGEEEPPKLTRKQKERARRRAAREKAEAYRLQELQSLKQTNAELLNRLTTVEGRGIIAEIESLDQKIANVKQHLAIAQTNQAQAIEAKNGKLYHDAKAYEANCLENLQKLDTYRSQMLEYQAQRAELAVRQTTPQPQSPSAPGVSKGHKWMADNPWFKPAADPGHDALSSYALQMDKEIKNEGYDPEADDYWLELTRRVEMRAKRMRKTTTSFAANIEPARRRGPPTGGGSNVVTNGRSNGKIQSLRLARERTDALKQMGISDPNSPEAKSYLKYFAEHDANNPIARSEQ